MLGEALEELGLRGIVDVHVHPLPELPEATLLSELKKAHVRRCVLLALDLDPSELEEERKKTRFLECLLNAGVWDIRALDMAREILRRGRTPNERVAELVRRHSGLFLGFGSVNPSKPSSYVREKLAEIADYGFRGLKLIPTLQMFCPSKAKKNLKRILRFCERSDLIVMWHTGCDPGPWESPALSECARPALLRPFVRTFGEVAFIIAHAGSYSAMRPGIWFPEALELAEAHENVWLDIAAVPYLLAEPEFARPLRAKGLVGRVLFGSDYPVMGGGASITEAIEVVLYSNELSPEEKAGVMALNAEGLLGL